jgi:hypothetical protein
MTYKTLLALSAVVVLGSGSAAVAQFYAPEYRAPGAQPGFVIPDERYRSINGTEPGSQLRGTRAGRHRGDTNGGD